MPHTPRDKPSPTSLAGIDNAPKRMDAGAVIAKRAPVTASTRAEDVILGDVPVSRAWLRANLPRSRPEALTLVHAYGDSMAGTLNSGDFALVDTDQRVVDVDGVYVLQANGQLFIKRVTRKMDGRYEVSSDNPKVRTVDVLDGSQQVRICGRVVYGWNGRRF